MPRRNNREYRMDPREVRALQELRRSDDEPAPSGTKRVSRKKQAKRQRQQPSRNWE